MKEALIEIVKDTDGWVIVVTFFLYFVYRSYKIYSSGSTVRQAMRINEITISSLLNEITTAINNLTTVVQQFKN